MRKPHGDPDSSYVPMTLEPDPLVLTLNTFSGGTWTQIPTSRSCRCAGLLSYEDFSSNHSIENQR
jgi:hypothetical protein